MFWVMDLFQFYLFCYFNIPATATVKTPPMSTAFQKLQVDELLTVTMAIKCDAFGKTAGCNWENDRCAI